MIGIFKKKKKNKFRDCLDLFLVFAKIGTFTFGGGYAMISFIEREVVDNKKWISKKDMSNIITIGESTPGPIAVNVASYVGNNVCGIIGAVSATLGVVLPSFLIILFLSTVLNSLQDNTIFKNAFFGIRVGIIALIINALISLYKQCSKDIYSYILMIGALISVVLFKVSSIIVLICCAIIGLILHISGIRKEKK